MKSSITYSGVKNLSECNNEEDVVSKLSEMLAAEMDKEIINEIFLIDFDMVLNIRNRKIKINNIRNKETKEIYSIKIEELYNLI